jgi:hypothetical protein
MNSESPDQPSLPSAGPHGRTGPTSRLRTSVLLVLGFAFTAAAVIGVPEKETAAPMALAAPVAGAYEASPGSLTGAFPVDSPEVTAAVRDWTWETPSAAVVRSTEHYDFTELWLAR